MLIGMFCDHATTDVLCSVHVHVSGNSGEGVSPCFHEQVIILVPVADEQNIERGYNTVSCIESTVNSCKVDSYARTEHYFTFFASNNLLGEDAGEPHSLTLFPMLEWCGNETRDSAHLISFPDPIPNAGVVAWE